MITSGEEFAARPIRARGNAQSTIYLTRTSIGNATLFLFPQEDRDRGSFTALSERPPRCPYWPGGTANAVPTILSPGTFSASELKGTSRTSFLPSVKKAKNAKYSQLDSLDKASRQTGSFRSLDQTAQLSITRKCHRALGNSREMELRNARNSNKQQGLVKIGLGILL